MAMLKATEQALALQIAAVKKQGGKDLANETQLWASETHWDFHGVFVGVHEIMTNDRAGGWSTGRIAVHVKADIGKPSRFGDRATASRQYCSKDPGRNASKAIATAKKFADKLAEVTRADAKRDRGFTVQVEQVKKLLGRELPKWAYFETKHEGELRFRLGTRAVTPEQACAIIRILEGE